MLRAMKIFRALCLAGIAVGLVVALWSSIRDASADPLPVTVPTTTVAAGPTKLGQAAVGLSGPIGAGVEGTTATGQVTGWRLPSFDLPDLPDAETAFRLVVGTIAVACLIVVAAVRI